jgi:hypothetical protein
VALTCGQGWCGIGAAGFVDGIGNPQAPGAVARFSNPMGVAFNGAGTQAFVADFGNGAIRTIDLTTGDRTVATILTGVGNPEHPRVHPTTGQVWFVGGSNGAHANRTLYRCNADGSGLTAVVTFLQLHDFVFDPADPTFGYCCTARDFFGGDGGVDVKKINTTTGAAVWTQSPGNGIVPDFGIMTDAEGVDVFTCFGASNDIYRQNTSDGLSPSRVTDTSAHGDVASGGNTGMARSSSYYAVSGEHNPGQVYDLSWGYGWSLELQLPAAGGPCEFGADGALYVCSSGLSYSPSSQTSGYSDRGSGCHAIFRASVVDNSIVGGAGGGGGGWAVTAIQRNR